MDVYKTDLDEELMIFTRSQSEASIGREDPNGGLSPDANNQ